jgi:hypothetical protein
MGAKMALSDPVDVSSIPNLNKNLSSARVSTMVEALGRPQEPLIQDDCRNAQASGSVKRLLETRRMTDNFSLTGIKPALDSAQAVLAKVKAANPDLIDQLRTEGMICVRHKNPTSGAVSLEPSNHSWGTAIDFKLLGMKAPGNTGSTVPQWVAILVPFFNEAGWYSGVGFHARDAMHFEVADETVRKWKNDGLLGTVRPEDNVVAGDGGGNLISTIGGFFSGLFGGRRA